MKPAGGGVFLLQITGNENNKKQYSKKVRGRETRTQTLSCSELAH